MTTNSMVYRTEYHKCVPDWIHRCPAGDFALSLILSSQGKVWYINEVMSVHRRDVKGSWSEMMSNFDRLKAFYYGTERMLLSFNRYTCYRYSIFIIIKVIFYRLQYYYVKIRHRLNIVKED